MTVSKPKLIQQLLAELLLNIAYFSFLKTLTLMQSCRVGKGSDLAQGGFCINRSTSTPLVLIRYCFVVRVFMNL